MRAGLGGTSPTHKATNIIACARRFLFLRSVLVERPSAVDGCGNVTVRIATDDGCVGVEQVWRKGSETYSTVLYSSLVQYK